MAYKSKIPITEILDMLNIPIPNTRRASFNIPCPICDNNDGRRRQEKHLNVNIQDDLWCCPKCFSGGTTVHFYGFMVHCIDPQLIKSNYELRKQLYAEISDKSGIIDYSDFQKKRIDIPRIDFPPTEINERDFTYSCLLNSLSLSDSHRDNLRKRGLPDEIIDRNGYKSVPLLGLSAIPHELRMKDACNLQGVPGFYKKNGQWTILKQNPGIFIPVRDIPEDFNNGNLGKIQGMQVRYDKEPKAGCKYMWFSTTDKESGSNAEVWTHFVGYPEKTVWITEGPLKGDIANYYLDEPFLCIPGVTCISHLEEKLRKLKSMGVCHIKSCFDMDYKTNPNVQRAYVKLVEMIESVGLTHERVNWDPKYKGIDDYLQHVYQKNNK